MKRKRQIVVTVFSILGGLGFMLVFPVIAIPSAPIEEKLITSILGPLALVGNIYALIVTQGFKLWGDELPRRVKVIATASWVVGGPVGVLGFLSLCMIAFYGYGV